MPSIDMKIELYISILKSIHSVFSSDFIVVLSIPKYPYQGHDVCCKCGVLTNK